MKKAFVTILGIILSFNVFSIDIVDIFYFIPSNNIDSIQKSIMLNYYFEETAQIKETERRPSNCNDFIYVIDRTNGYLSLSTNCGDGGIEYCYWNQKNGDKIIAINEYGWATSKYTEAIDFYLLKEDSILTKLDSDIVISYESIKNELFKSLDNQTKKEAEQEHLFDDENIVFKLPRYGKNIIASIGVDNSGNWLDKFIRKKECKLKWKNLKLEVFETASK